jgi:hypothetical protein
LKGRPEQNEAASQYFLYIDRIAGNDVISALETQTEEASAFLRGISEAKSLYRYAPEKWSIRQILNHLNDTERIMAYRALWFARGFDSPLPSFDQNIAAAAARADDIPWATHIEEFQAIRRSTIHFFQNLPEEAWIRSGVASGNPFTVRALAYTIAGHAAHHMAIVRERYL